MSAEAFHGAWEIVDVINISKVRNLVPAVIHGAVFVLKENGEIQWELPTNVDHGFLLFLTQCYEVVHTFVGVCIQMGAVSGHIFEWWVDRPVPRDTMLLTSDGWCMLECRQRQRILPPIDFPFSLLPALEEGYFSDVKLPEDYDDQGTFLREHKGAGEEQLKEFPVHSVILNLTGWDSHKKEISKLEPDVLGIVLHYLYSQSLPATLSVEQARKCIGRFDGDEKSKELKKLLEDYVYRITLKEKIVKLVNDVHSSLDSMTTAFKEHSATTPSRFSYVGKLALRDGGVALLKLTELCVAYGDAAPLLRRSEGLEILRYAKTRLPIFLKQLVSLLRSIKNDFSCLRPSERNDIASYIAPGIERLLGALSSIMKEGKDASNEIWSKWSTTPNYPETLLPTGSSSSGGNTEGDESQSSQSQCFAGLGVEGLGVDSLTEAIHGIFRKRETVKLHHVQSQLASMYLYLAQKKENFEDMTHAVKTRCISRNLEQLLDELPVFLLRIEEIMIAFDDRFQWKDFKFCLQLVISQVCQTVQHLKRERTYLQKFFTLLSELVQRDEFHQSLVNLGLLEVPVLEGEGGGGGGVNAGGEVGVGASGGDKPDKRLNVPDVHAPTNGNPRRSPSPRRHRRHAHRPLFESEEMKEKNDLNLVEAICTPRIAKESPLAQNAVSLYEALQNNPEGTDMVFEIIQDGDPVEIPAHRVIVAARCIWFRRALLSGMKESISKRISIHDCPVSMFQLFLRFIYTGLLPQEVSLEVLCDLIALSDRYEMDTLKLYCEHELSVRHLDDASVIFLLSLSDQYNARTLRGSTMEYIASNPAIMAKEMFEELSPELQMEVYDITMWSKPKRYT